MSDKASKVAINFGFSMIILKLRAVASPLAASSSHTSLTALILFEEH